jgi:hypothetical protein
MGQILITIAALVALLGAGVVAGSSVAPVGGTAAQADAIMPSGGG